MASSSNQRSGSSGRSSRRRKVVISARETSRVRNTQPEPKVESRHSTRRQSNPNVEAAARRVVNSKRVEREKRLRIQRNRFRLKVALIVGVTASIVFGVVGLYRSQVFEIRTVRIEGNDRVSDEQVLEIAAMPTGSTLLRFPGAGMKNRLEADPWISSVQVTRDFPDTVVVRIVERAPVALVDVPEEQFWLVDRSGVMITQATPENTATPVVIRDVTGLDPQVGTRTTSEPLLNALAVWTGISDDLRARTRAISAPSIDKTALITKDDVEIFVGAVDDIEKKDTIVRSILDDQAGKVVYINVRTVDRPTWRGIDE